MSNTLRRGINNNIITKDERCLLINNDIEIKISNKVFKYCFYIL